MVLLYTYATDQARWARDPHLSPFNAAFWLTYLSPGLYAIARSDYLTVAVRLPQLPR